MPDQDFTIWVITDDTPEETAVTRGARNSGDTGGGWNNKPAEGSKKRVPLNALALKAQMEGLIHVVGDLFTTAEAQTGMQLNEVQL
jgi:hypothetical protein